MRKHLHAIPCGLVIILVITSSIPLSLAQTTRTKPTNGRKPEAINVTDGPARESEMRPAIERFVVDRGSLTRSYPVSFSQARRDRFRQFYTEWLNSLQKMDFDSMSQDGKIDYLL